MENRRRHNLLLCGAGTLNSSGWNCTWLIYIRLSSFLLCRKSALLFHGQWRLVILSRSLFWEGGELRLRWEHAKLNCIYKSLFSSSSLQGFLLRSSRASVYFARSWISRIDGSKNDVIMLPICTWVETPNSVNVLLVRAGVSRYRTLYFHMFQTIIPKLFLAQFFRLFSQNFVFLTEKQWVNNYFIEIFSWFSVSNLLDTDILWKNRKNWWILLRLIFELCRFLSYNIH
jgi:hypothetical protein